ncbi:pentatricopeptide repeat-containing protein At3g04130, mitochondrial isoform X2 [Lycium barbarum]|uniref:pentatricopeptide repeat-containing protein At3g04130, mitochondrial isoform X2 n=1 Tax=Lycium barbarum TaxID=112863 RepID=UPI00293E2F22|nr:pentatricopeptide repeat-containing protein At3g04130, mitochondrial isoform X2 [Lycium barbarum]
MANLGQSTAVLHQIFEGLCSLSRVLTTFRINPGSSEAEVVQSLLSDPDCDSIKITDNFVGRVLYRFKDDWKSALGVFRWAQSRPDYKPSPELYDKLVDILGKMKKMEKMHSLIDEMHAGHLISLNTIAKVMRRFAGAGEWKEAVRTFDELGKFGLEKNTESMNLLLDTLCKENRVQQAREIFYELKLHIPPNANTFNIFIHGWCKANRVEEAYWTIQEMKGSGCCPCVISYSTIIKSYCQQFNFQKVYELLDEMQGQGCLPNVVTFTTIMCFLKKSGAFEEALKIAERMKSVGCKPDTLFYNALIHTLGVAHRLQEATRVLKVEMPRNGVQPNTSTYNTIIAMFCHHLQEERALEFLRDLESSPVCKPDVQSYFPLLKLWFKVGKSDEFLKILVNDIVNKHHLSLDLSSYALLIHGLCRANKCEWAYLIFEDMIRQEITPRYKTCSVLLQEVKKKNMYDAADRIELFMKKMKTA